jgi:hypothetical protein
VNADVLLAGFGGALLVFLLGALREWWREEREREGLLRLLLAEIDHNDEVARTIGETRDDLLGSPDFPSMTTETWRDVQGRAAALLPDDLATALNDYYSALQTLLTLLTFDDLINQRTNRATRQMFSEMLEREFPASRNPWNDYLNATLARQERARAEIDAYLKLPWDQRLLLRLVRWLERLGRRVRRSPEAVKRGAVE